MNNSSTVQRQPVAPNPEHIDRLCWLRPVICLLSAGVLTGLLTAVGCNRENVPPLPDSSLPDHSSRIVFADVTEETGVDARYLNGEEAKFRSILESLGGGVAALDFDADGHVDLYFPQGGTLSDSLSPQGLPGELFRQISYPGFLPVAGKAGLKTSAHYAHGAFAADYDQDGFVDLLITGYGGLTLFRNSGDGTFEPVTEISGLDDQQWSSSAAWGDVSGDGVPDLYVAHYVDWSPSNHPACSGPTPTEPDVCPPRRFRGLTDTLYISRGDGTFENVSETAGLQPEGKGLGVLLADLDDDRDLDIYVANDTVENFLYLNDGSGTLTEQGMLSGVAVDHDGNANGSMGIALLDADASGTLDLWVTNYESELFALYLSQTPGQFIHESTQWGLNRLESLFVGFGTVAADFDLDGDEDIAVANGHVILFPSNAPVRQQPLILENHEQHLLAVPSDTQPLLQTARRGRGLATADLDENGLPDLVFSNSQEICSIGLNQSETSGSSISLRLIGTQSAREPVGAMIHLRSPQGNQIRQLTAGGSYLSTSENRVHFGLPEGTDFASVSLEIHWPSGLVREILPATLSPMLLRQPRLKLDIVEQGRITSPGSR